MDMKAVGGEFKVCLCKDKTKDEVMNYIRENNIHDLNELRTGMDIGNKCGGCAEDLESLIKLVWE